MERSQISVQLADANYLKTHLGNDNGMTSEDKYITGLIKIQIVLLIY